MVALVRALFVTSIVLCCFSTGSFAAEPRAALDDPIDLAFVIGNNRHLSRPDRSLQFADDDAVRVIDTLRTLNPHLPIWALLTPDSPAGADRLQTLGITPRPPTATAFLESIQEIRAKIESLRQSSRQPITVFFYFSGHGEHLLGATRFHLEDQRLSTARWIQELSKLEADRVISLLDACSLTTDLKGDAPLTRLPDLAPNRPHWMAVIGASTQIPEVTSLRGGLLTAIAVTGLLGAADGYMNAADRNGHVTFLEWGKFIQTQFRDVDVIKPEPDPFVPVARLTGNRLGGLTFDERFPTGHVWIEAETPRGPDRWIKALFYHHRGTRVNVRLEPGPYRVFVLDERPAPGHSRKGWRSQVTVPVGGSNILDPPLVRIQFTPEDLKGISLPAGEEGIEAEPGGYEVEQRMARMPFQIPPAPALLPGWSVALRVDPVLGPRFVGSPERTPGGGARLGRTWPFALTRRWHRAGGVALGYQLTYEGDLLATGPGGQATCDRTLLQELRAGALLSQTWYGPRVRLGLEQSVSWSPRVLTCGASLQANGNGSRPNIDLTAITAGLSVGLLFPLFRTFEAGPRIQAELMFGDPQHTVPYDAAYLGLGLELRTASLR